MLKIFGILEARKGRYRQSVSLVLSPLSQNLSWSRSLCRYLELPNRCRAWCKNEWYFYRDAWLSQHLLLAIRSVADFFTIQQDNAPSQQAGDTVEFLSRNTPDFISPLLWPTNSPDLNPVDYEAWGVLQQCVYLRKIRDDDH